MVVARRVASTQGMTGGDRMMGGIDRGRVFR